MEHITSIKDPRVKIARELTRAANCIRQCLLEGEDAIQWALDYNLSLEHVFIAEQYKNSSIIETLQSQSIPVYICSDGILKKITETKYLTPFITVANLPSTKISSSSPFILGLENLQDQGNIGTIMRTAAALGVTDWLLSGKSQHVYSKKTIRASRGTVFAGKKYCVENMINNLSELKKSGYQIIVTSPHTQTLQSQVELENKPIVLIVGNETQGVTDHVKAIADHVVKIPMADAVESLNVGVAAGMSLYEIKLKGILAMLTENIRATLGRNLGVTHQLVRQLLDAALTAQSEFSANDLLALMILACQPSETLSNLSRDLRLSESDCDVILVQHKNKNYLVELEENIYQITPDGEACLAQCWQLIQNAESKALQGFSDEEKQLLNDFLRRIQVNCN